MAITTTMTQLSTEREKEDIQLVQKKLISLQIRREMTRISENPSLKSLVKYNSNTSLNIKENNVKTLDCPLLAIAFNRLAVGFPFIRKNDDIWDILENFIHEFHIRGISNSSDRIQNTKRKNLGKRLEKLFTYSFHSALTHSNSNLTSTIDQTHNNEYKNSNTSKVDHESHLEDLLKSNKGNEEKKEITQCSSNNSFPSASTSCHTLISPDKIFISSSTSSSSCSPSSASSSSSLIGIKIDIVSIRRDIVNGTGLKSMSTHIEYVISIQENGKTSYVSRRYGSFRKLSKDVRFISIIFIFIYIFFLFNRESDLVFYYFFHL